jgi:hypothetical protein
VEEVLSLVAPAASILRTAPTMDGVVPPHVRPRAAAFAKETGRAWQAHHRHAACSAGFAICSARRMGDPLSLRAEHHGI